MSKANIHIYGKSRVFTGHLHPDLEDLLLSHLMSLKSEDPLGPAYVMVGSNLLAAYLRRKLADRGAITLNIKFIVPLELIRLLNSWDSDAKPFISGPGIVRMVGKMISAMGKDNYFSPISDKAGFPRALASSLTEMREAFGAGPIDAGGLSMSRKVADLVVLYNCLQDELRRFDDIAALFDKASGKASDFAGIMGTDKLFIYGFYNFSVLEAKLIAALSRHTAVTAYLPWTSGQAYRLADDSLSFYMDLGFEHLKAVNAGDPASYGDLRKVREAIVLTGRGPSEPSINRDSGALEKGGGLQILACPGEEREVKEIARQIMDLAKSGVAFRDMAVLLRNTETYRQIIIDSFNRLKIPFFFPDGLSLRRLPYVQGARLLLELRGSEYRRRDVTEYLSEAPLNTDFSAPGEWIRLSRLCGIVKGRDEWLDRLGSMGSGARLRGVDQISDNDRDSAIRLASYLKTLFDDLESFPDSGSWSDFCGMTANLFSKHLATGDGTDAVNQTLDSLSKLDIVEPETDFAGFRRMFLEQVGQLSDDIGHYECGGVNILPLMSARGLSFDAVFIPGLTEKDFPNHGGTDPILTAGDRVALNRAVTSGALPNPSVDRPKEEKFLFWTALRSAGKALVLSYPATDRLACKERRPSPFLLDVASVLTNGIATLDTLESLPGYRRFKISQLAPADAQNSIDRREYNLAALLHGGGEAYLSAVSSSAGEILDCNHSRRDVGFLTRWDGRVGSRANASLLANHSLIGRSISPSFVEQFCRCPYSIFLSGLLSLEAVEEPEVEWKLAGIDKGTLIHGILFSFFETLQQRKLLPMTPDNRTIYREIMLSCADRYFLEFERLGVTSHGLLWDIDKESILKDLLGQVDDEIDNSFDFRPVLLEASFGDEPDIVELEAGLDRKIRFKGRIDRVDCRPGGAARVIDYKSGRPKTSDNSLSGGRASQLPIYTIAAKALLRRMGVGADSITAYYYHATADNGYRRIGFSTEDLKQKKDAFIGILAWIEDSICQGVFPQYPGKDKENCALCQFGPVCGTNIDIIIEGKISDPLYQAYLGIREVE